ncbi:traD domain protein [Escherichia coli P0304816.4]|nr:traD domain protein [Escherichia coli P0304816.4]
MRKRHFHPCCADQLRESIRYLQGIEHNGEPSHRDWMRGVRKIEKRLAVYSSMPTPMLPETGDLHVAVHAILAVAWGNVTVVCGFL